MKKRMQRQLRMLSRIERRIERENQRNADEGRPVLRGKGAVYEIADRVRAVPAGVVALIQRMVQAIGLDTEIDESVHLLKVHAPYHESDHVTNIAYNLLAGGECLEHLELLRNDENYPDMLDPEIALELDELGTQHTAAIQGLIPFGPGAGLRNPTLEQRQPRARTSGVKKKHGTDHHGFSLR